MGVFAGTVISSGQPAGISVPTLTPILVVPPGQQFNLTGFAFTNTSAVVQNVSVFRGSLNVAPLFTLAIAALAGVGAVPVAQQASTQVLFSGEILYAVPALVSGYYAVSVEIDGYMSANQDMAPPPIRTP
jgi:hypothetical protein